MTDRRNPWAMRSVDPAVIEREGDVVLVTDAGAGPYEALVESISGSWAQLRVGAFAKAVSCLPGR